MLSSPQMNHEPKSSRPLKNSKSIYCPRYYICSHKCPLTGSSTIQAITSTSPTYLHGASLNLLMIPILAHQTPPQTNQGACTIVPSTLNNRGGRDLPTILLLHISSTPTSSPIVSYPCNYHQPPQPPPIEPFRSSSTTNIPSPISSLHTPSFTQIFPRYPKTFNQRSENAIRNYL